MSGLFAGNKPMDVRGALEEGGREHEAEGGQWEGRGESEDQWTFPTNYLGAITIYDPNARLSRRAQSLSPSGLPSSLSSSFLSSVSSLNSGT